MAAGIRLAAGLADGMIDAHDSIKGGGTLLEVAECKPRYLAV